MNIGLPVTGLGGVFYLLCAILMPFYELVLTLRGRSSRARWLVVARQWAIGVAILLVLALTYREIGVLRF